MLTFACWRCWLGGAYPACVMEQAGRFKTVVLAVIQVARVMEQGFPEYRHESLRIQAARVMEQDKGVTKCDTLGDTGRACDGAANTASYARLVKRYRPRVVSANIC